ncbi:MAG: hypothetical protein LBI84_04875 [Propionibacteriaceae bacterium]|nr:hypothetical protein [Propionibacteriaceae bacterium]
MSNPVANAQATMAGRRVAKRPRSQSEIDWTCELASYEAKPVWDYERTCLVTRREPADPEAEDLDD